MRIENHAANTRDIDKIQVSLQESVNSDFVRRIQNRSASAAVTSDLKTKIKSRKEFSIRRMKVE
jgi:hypothetical protein